MLFFLTIISDFFGIHGRRLRDHLHERSERHPVLLRGLPIPPLSRHLQGLVKPLFSGFIISSIGCFYGLRTTGGTQGVGRSTIQAVVFRLRPASSSWICWSARSWWRCSTDEHHRTSAEPPAAASKPSRCSVSTMSRSPSMGPRCSTTSASPSARTKPAILLGPAGVGKSVLLKLANGLHCPTAAAFCCLAKISSPCAKPAFSPCVCAPAWSSRKARSSIRSPCATTSPTS